KVITLRQTLEIVTRGNTQCHRCAPLVARGCPVSPWGLGLINPPVSSYHRPPPGDREAQFHAPRLQWLPNNGLSDTDVAMSNIAGYDACYGDSMASHWHTLASHALALPTITYAEHDKEPPREVQYRPGMFDCTAKRQGGVRTVRTGKDHKSLNKQPKSLQQTLNKHPFCQK